LPLEVVLKNGAPLSLLRYPTDARSPRVLLIDAGLGSVALSCCVAPEE